jgi:2-iminoacetate synthase ThiH
MADLVEGKEYYLDEATGYLVFTAYYHLKRGYCCHSGCRHCPFRSEDKEPTKAEKK